MILFILYSLLILWIGYLLRDYYVRQRIEYASRKFIGDAPILSGDTINYLKNITILSSEQQQDLIMSIPDDDTLDGGFMPLPLKRLMYRLLNTIIVHVKKE